MTISKKVPEVGITPGASLAPMSEEQIKERVNGWIEKYQKYIEHQAQKGDWDEKQISKEEKHLEFCKGCFPRELRKDPSWIPWEYNPTYPQGPYQIPMPFLTWVEE
jgi:hypothetical protein